MVQVFFIDRCDNLSKKQIRFSSSEYFCLDLGNLRNEIQVLSKDKYPKILEDLDSNKIFDPNNTEFIQNLVSLQQKLLSLTAIKYGIYDIKTSSLANNYLCSLAFRIFAVSRLLNNSEFKISDINKTILKRIEYCEWIKYLSYSNVLNYKISITKRMFLSKTKIGERALSVCTVSDKLIRMLFVLVYEPIVECVSDICNFGFRKNRYAHQAIGVLFSKLHWRFEKEQSFYVSRYILKYNICKFLDNVNRSWLIDVFPAHIKHKVLVNVFLKPCVGIKKFKYYSSEILFYENEVGSLFANFALNGVEELIQPEKFKYVNEAKRR
jgi:hypothetical protein